MSHIGVSLFKHLKEDSTFFKAIEIQYDVLSFILFGCYGNPIHLFEIKNCSSTTIFILLPDKNNCKNFLDRAIFDGK